MIEVALHALPDAYRRVVDGEVLTKSGIMVGLGETFDEVVEVTERVQLCQFVLGIGRQ